jgi:hypothetical protein
LKQNWQLSEYQMFFSGRVNPARSSQALALALGRKLGPFSVSFVTSSSETQNAKHHHLLA